MENNSECFATNIIEKSGLFNAQGLDNFIEQAALTECGLTYVTVSIIGVQGSGKSTLLNHLFHTNFKEMDASRGRTQTTTGIWIAKCNGIRPCTVVMDIEGTDGRERGEDDTAFEKQSALFSIAVSDIVIINMWYSDIGRSHAANIPLLKVVFQVMLRLSGQSRTTLMLLIRDTSSKIPFETLKKDLVDGIKEIWDSVPKPQAHMHAQLSDFFNIEVAALCHYELQIEKFKEQVATLRQKFFCSNEPGGLAWGTDRVVPAEGFSLNAQEIWQRIINDKDLNLPSVKVMVANIRCEQIAEEICSWFAANQVWVTLKEDVKSGRVPSFGQKLDSLFDICFSKYEKDASYFDETIRSEKRKLLKQNLMQLVLLTYGLMLEHILSDALKNIKSALEFSLSQGQVFSTAADACTEKGKRVFDLLLKDASSKLVDWDNTEIENRFSHDVVSHIIEVQSDELKKRSKQYKLLLEEALNTRVGALLKEASDETWPKINNLFSRETDRVVSGFSIQLSKYKINRQEKEGMVSKLTKYARRLVEKKAIEEAGIASYLMKERFESIFRYGSDSNLRDWTEDDNIQAIAETARSSTRVLLSVLAANRLGRGPDSILNTLRDGTTTSPDMLNSDSWEQVPDAITLINPSTCKDLWGRFEVEAESTIAQALLVQKAKEKKGKPKTAGAAAFVVPYKKTIVGTACATGIIGIVVVATGANPIAVAAVGGLVGGAGVTAVLASFAVRSLKYMAGNTVENIAQRMLGLVGRRRVHAD